MRLPVAQYPVRKADMLCDAPEPKAIAEPGFQFLLLDTYSQLWLLLQQYIADAQKKAGEQLPCATYAAVSMSASD